MRCFRCLVEYCQIDAFSSLSPYVYVCMYEGCRTMNSKRGHLSYLESVPSDENRKTELGHQHQA